MPADHPRFYYDLRSPDAWLAAETIVHDLGEVPEFVPVMASRDSADLDDVARRAAALEVIAFRPPAVFPPGDTTFAMLAATYAKQIGKVVAFSLAAFRQAFAAGRDLADQDTVLLAGAAAEIHPKALIKGAALKGTAERLRVATEQAIALGVLDVPAVSRDGRLL
ncbi:MAG: DsbA family protein [Solirubrobacteraceae bacterium]